VLDWLTSVHSAVVVYAQGLRDYGYEDTALLCEATAEEIQDAFEDVGMKKPHQKMVRTAHAALRAAAVPPPPPDAATLPSSRIDAAGQPQGNGIDGATMIAQWKTLAPSDGDGAGGGQTAPPEAPAPTAQAPSVLLSKSDQTPIKNWLEHKLADAVAAVAEVNIPGDSCSCAVEWVGTKFTYDGDFVTRACQQSASKTAAKMSADNKTVDAAGVACALAKRLEAELQARLPLDQLWGVSCNALGQVRVSFLGSAAEVASRVRPQIVLEQKAPEAALEADGVVAARDATVHNLNAVNAALYHMVEALRPFMHQFLPQFFDHCKAESATSGASMHHVVLSLATGKSMADITALTNEEHGKSRDYFVKHINGNDKQTPEDYNFDIANWFEVQAPEYASLIHSLH
jgi:hypothetical protein